MGGIGIKMASAKNNQLISSQGPHFSPHSTAKISDVVTVSVYSEKTHMKKLMMMMNKSQEMTVFGGRQKLTSAMKLMPEKWW